VLLLNQALLNQALRRVLRVLRVLQVLLGCFLLVSVSRLLFLCSSATSLTPGNQWDQWRRTRQLP